MIDRCGLFIVYYLGGAVYVYILEDPNLNTLYLTFYFSAAFFYLDGGGDG